MTIAYTRWAWGVSPAFVTPDSEAWHLVMGFGMIVDATAVTALIAAIVTWWREVRKPK